MLYKASIMRESEYYFADNPWSCNCHNIKIIQEFLSKYNNIILDVDYMQCTECDCSIVFLDYKEMCGASSTNNMIWLIVLEPGNRGLPRIISARMQPRLHMTTPAVYFLEARRISGARYHLVAT